MSKDLGTYELIQKYLSGMLSGVELSDFEKRISSEPDFKNYVESHQMANLLIKRNALNSIKSELQKIHAENHRSGGNWKKIVMLLVGLMLFIYTWNFFNSHSNHFLKEATNKHSNVAEDGEINVVKNIVSPEINHEQKDKQEEVKSVLKTKTNDDAFLKQEESLSNEVPHLQDGLPKMDTKKIDNGSLNGSELAQEMRPKDEDIESISSYTKVSKDSNCDPFEVNLELKMLPTCDGKNEGFVQIKNEEFHNNYEFRIDQRNPQKEASFTDLVAGEHKIYVIDDMGCSSESVLINIAAVDCEVIVHRAQNIYWDIPSQLSNNPNTLLKIYDAKGGQLVYQSRLDQFQQNVWDGSSSFGAPLPMGAYIYVCEFDGKRLTGNITILQ